MKNLQETVLVVICVLLGLAVIVSMMYSKPRDTVIYFKGKPYVAYSLVGEGRTHKNRVPVYRLAVVPLEQAKDAV